MTDNEQATMAALASATERLLRVQALSGSNMTDSDIRCLNDAVVAAREANKVLRRQANVKALARASRGAYLPGGMQP